MLVVPANKIAVAIQSAAAALAIGRRLWEQSGCRQYRRTVQIHRQLSDWRTMIMRRHVLHSEGNLQEAWQDCLRLGKWSQSNLPYRCEYNVSQFPFLHIDLQFMVLACIPGTAPAPLTLLGLDIAIALSHTRSQLRIS